MSNRKKIDLNDFIVTRELPHKSAEEYYASLNIMKHATKNWDPDNAKNSPDQELIKEETRFYYNEEKLNQKREEYFKTKKILDNQWAELTEKELAFRENFIKFNLFVRQNIEKRERALAKVSEQRELRDQRQADVNNLKQSILAVQNTKAVMDNNINTHKIYENFLDEVTKRDDSEFKTIDDILRRFQCLKETKKYLGDKQQQSMLCLEQAQLELDKKFEQNALVLSNLTNKICDLNERFTKAHRCTVEKEHTMNYIKDNVIKNVRDIFNIKQVCWMLYLKMCKRKMYPVTIEYEDLEKQLVFIKKTLSTVMKITNLLYNTMSNSRHVDLVM